MRKRGLLPNLNPNDFGVCVCVCVCLKENMPTKPSVKH